tara:strand:+ start:1139 stop:2269 length:1131 start_codon:yes stop_codon:yes gene_type:complete
MFSKKNSFSLAEAKKFLNKRGLKLFKKSLEPKLHHPFKSLYYTFFSGVIIIMLSFFSPIFVTYKNEIFSSSKEVKNNSKIKLEKVLKGESIEEEQQEEINNAQVFEDIFEYENIPTDTVRLNASTIEQLFKDTDYNLDDVRKKKFVKPINLNLLPSEMKMIGSSEKRKRLFIQIILPLILEENNQIIASRTKLFSILNKSNNSEAEKKWLNMKFKQYGVKKNDLFTLKYRMDVVPVSLAIAQAAKETGWGTSRFAIEGNALFGQWTYSGAGLKPKGADSDQTHKVMKFSILKASIKAYQRNLNTHSSYKKFRRVRAIMRDNDEKLDSMLLADYLDLYAETGKEYTKILKQIIKQNSLTDFDDVKLLPITIKLKNLI